MIEEDHLKNYMNKTIGDLAIDAKNRHEDVIYASQEIFMRLISCRQTLALESIAESLKKLAAIYPPKNRKDGAHDRPIWDQPDSRPGKHASTRLERRAALTGVPCTDGRWGVQLLGRCRPITSGRVSNITAGRLKFQIISVIWKTPILQTRMNTRGKQLWKTSTRTHTPSPSTCTLSASTTTISLPKQRLASTWHAPCGTKHLIAACTQL